MDDRLGLRGRRAHEDQRVGHARTSAGSARSARGVLPGRAGCPCGALARPGRHAGHRANLGAAPRPDAAGSGRQTAAAVALVALVLLRALHRLAALLPRLSRLPFSFDGWLLVVSSALHLLKEAVLQHLLLELLEGGLDLVVEDLDLHAMAA